VPNRKDEVENFLHDKVCRGAMVHAQDKRQITIDWRSVVAAGRVQSATATPTD
jgi:hypothetical protein